MEELQPQPLPEASELRYPEPDWNRRFFSIFDWYRAQPVEIRAEALRQWEQEGKAHFMNGARWVAENRFELWYSEQGNFFIEVNVKGNKIVDMMYFQSEDCLRKFGVSVISKAKELGYNPPRIRE